MALTLIQGHKDGEKQNFCATFLTIFLIGVNVRWYAVESFWSEKAHTPLILSNQCSKERTLLRWIHKMCVNVTTCVWTCLCVCLCVCVCYCRNYRVCVCVCLSKEGCIPVRDSCVSYACIVYSFDIECNVLSLLIVAWVCLHCGYV